MLGKRRAIILLLVLIFAGSVFALNVSEIEPAIYALLDEIQTSLVCYYSPEKINLPNHVLSINPDTMLPERISFFLADPYDFEYAISSNTAVYNDGFFTSLLSFLTRQEKDPNITAMYLVLISRKYHSGDYSVSGTISFRFHDNIINKDRILEILTSHNPESVTVLLDVDTRIEGLKLANPLVIQGKFDLCFDQDRQISIVPVEDYTINGESYRTGGLTVNY